MRIKIILSIILLFYSLLIYRVYQLSIKSNEKYSKLSVKNREKQIPIAPIRGVIYDRNSNPLAYNELRFDIALRAHLNADELNESIKDIKETLSDINTTKLIDEYKKENSPYNHKPIVLLKYLDEETMYKI